MGMSWLPFGIGSLLSGAGAIMGAGGPSVTSGVTPESINRGIGYIDRGYGEAENRFSTPFTAGGVTFAPPMSSAQVKQANLTQALTDYYISRGKDPTAASKRANEVRKPGGKMPKEVKGFQDWLKTEGGQYGLTSEAGKIVGIPTGGSVGYGQRSGTRHS